MKFLLLLLVSVLASCDVSDSYKSIKPALSVASQQLIRELPSDKVLENQLELALTQKPGDRARMGKSDEVIAAYSAVGMINKDPDKTSDYSRYHRLKRTSMLLGHTLLAIDEEKQVGPSIGCCPDPGLAVLLEVKPDGADLQNFAAQSGCRLNQKSSLMHVFEFPKTGSNNITVLECKESDLTFSSGAAVVTPQAAEFTPKDHEKKNSVGSTSSAHLSLPTHVRKTVAYRPFAIWSSKLAISMSDVWIANKFMCKPPQAVLAETLAMLRDFDLVGSRLEGPLSLTSFRGIQDGSSVIVSLAIDARTKSRVLRYVIVNDETVLACDCYALGECD